MATKIGDKSHQSNIDKWSSDFGSFSVKYLITTVLKSQFMNYKVPFLLIAVYFFIKKLFEIKLFFVNKFKIHGLRIGCSIGWVVFK